MDSMQFQCFTREYVDQLRERDPETEQHFIDYFSDLLFLKLRRIMQTRQSVEDLKQETFYRVFRVLRADGLRNPERIGAFVNTVCNNVIAEYWRASSRFTSLPDPVPDRPSCHGRASENELINEERTRAIRLILDELPVRDREILRMLFLEERNKDDVCRTWSINRDYLRVLVHRAKDRFRQKLPEISAVAAVCALDRAGRRA